MRIRACAKGYCYNTSPLVTKEGGTRTSCGCLGPVLMLEGGHEVGDDRTTMPLVQVVAGSPVATDAERM